MLQDKVVLVTGSTMGIGQQIARAALARGAKVMLHGRGMERGPKLVKELGSHTNYVAADLSKPEGYREVVAKTVEAFGRIDVLINNAAQSPRNDIDSLSEEDFDWIIRLNMRSPLLLAQAAVRQFRTQKSAGTIVNIGSINAYCGQTDLLVYSMTKGALMTMTRNLGDALCPEGIRVNQVNVGWTLTDNEAAIKEGEGFPPDWEKFIPEVYRKTGHLLRPEQVAEHVLFWASEASAPATGQVYELEQYPVIGRNLINTIELKGE